MLGGHDVGDGAGLLGPVDQDGVAAGAQGGLEVGPPGRVRHDPVDLRPTTASATSSDQVISQASPSGPCSAWTTRSMAASSAGVSGAGDHHHLGGPGEGRGHTDHPGDLALGLGHVAVARTRR